jgi:endo-1,4-beta-xylanase
VWVFQLPGWLRDGNFSGPQLQAILENHIATVVGHYRDRFPGVVVEWDVVNEMTIAGLGIWGRIGDVQTVAGIAFRAARAADPSVKLYYNGDKNDSVSNDMLNGQYTEVDYTLLSTLKNNGVPIDGVGFQGHFLPNYIPKIEDMVSTMQRYASLGLEMKFTEVDVMMLTSNSAENLNTEATIYGNVMTACLRVSACKGVVTWGFTDKYSWLPSYFPGTGWGLPFDSDYQPKPAVHALVAALKGTQ